MSNDLSFFFLSVFFQGNLSLNQKFTEQLRDRHSQGFTNFTMIFIEEVCKTNRLYNYTEEPRNSAFQGTRGLIARDALLPIQGDQPQLWDLKMLYLWK